LVEVCLKKAKESDVSAWGGHAFNAPIDTSSYASSQ